MKAGLALVALGANTEHSKLSGSRSSLPTAGLMQDSSYPPFERLVSDAFVRFESNLRAALPNTAPQAS